MISADQYLLVFFSIHDVMATEQLCKAAQIPCDVVPISGEISADCGMGVVIKIDAFPLIYERLRDKRLVLRGVYRYLNHQYLAENLNHLNNKTVV